MFKLWDAVTEVARREIDGFIYGITGDRKRNREEDVESACKRMKMSTSSNETETSLFASVESVDSPGKIEDDTTVFPFTFSVSTSPKYTTCKEDCQLRIVALEAEVRRLNSELSTYKSAPLSTTPSTPFVSDTSIAFKAPPPPPPPPIRSGSVHSVASTTTSTRSHAPGMGTSSIAISAARAGLRPTNTFTSNLTHPSHSPSMASIGGTSGGAIMSDFLSELKKHKLRKVPSMMQPSQGTKISEGRSELQIVLDTTFKRKLVNRDSPTTPLGRSINTKARSAAWDSPIPTQAQQQQQQPQVRTSEVQTPLDLQFNSHIVTTDSTSPRCEPSLHLADLKIETLDIERPQPQLVTREKYVVSTSARPEVLAEVKVEEDVILPDIFAPPSTNLPLLTPFNRSRNIKLSPVTAHCRPRTPAQKKKNQNRKRGQPIAKLSILTSQRSGSREKEKENDESKGIQIPKLESEDEMDLIGRDDCHTEVGKR